MGKHEKPKGGKHEKPKQCNDSAPGVNHTHQCTLSNGHTGMHLCRVWECTVRW